MRILRSILSIGAVLLTCFGSFGVGYRVGYADGLRNFEWVRKELSDGIAAATPVASHARRQ